MNWLKNFGFALSTQQTTFAIEYLANLLLVIYRLFSILLPETKPWVHANFGCKAFFKVQTHQIKLQPRAKLGVFCGYDESCYIIFNQETGKFISTPHVKFDEKHFV